MPRWSPPIQNDNLADPKPVLRIVGRHESPAALTPGFSRIG
jgi:hypothetical protein